MPQTIHININVSEKTHKKKHTSLKNKETSSPKTIDLRLHKHWYGPWKSCYSHTPPNTKYPEGDSKKQNRKKFKIQDFDKAVDYVHKYAHKGFVALTLQENKWCVRTSKVLDNHYSKSDSFGRTDAVSGSRFGHPTKNEWSLVYDPSVENTPRMPLKDGKNQPVQPIEHPEIKMTTDMCRPMWTDTYVKHNDLNELIQEITHNPEETDRYLMILKALGIDTCESLSYWTEEELVKEGLLKGHARMICRKLA